MRQPRPYANSCDISRPLWINKVNSPHFEPVPFRWRLLDGLTFRYFAISGSFRHFADSHSVIFAKNRASHRLQAE
jgi:hypothetical protein